MSNQPVDMRTVRLLEEPPERTKSLANGCATIGTQSRRVELDFIMATLQSRKHSGRSSRNTRLRDLMKLGYTLRFERKF